MIAPLSDRTIAINQKAFAITYMQQEPPPPKICPK